MGLSHVSQTPELGSGLLASAHCSSPLVTHCPVPPSVQPPSTHPGDVAREPAAALGPWRCPSPCGSTRDGSSQDAQLGMRKFQVLPKSPWKPPAQAPSPAAGYAPHPLLSSAQWGAGQAEDSLVWHLPAAFPLIQASVSPLWGCTCGDSALPRGPQARKPRPWVGDSSVPPLGRGLPSQGPPGLKVHPAQFSHLQPGGEDASPQQQRGLAVPLQMAFTEHLLRAKCCPLSSWDASANTTEEKNLSLWNLRSTRGGRR